MASSATRTLPFVYGLLMRPQATPLEVGGFKITSDDRNEFVAARRGTSNAPRVSVLTCRTLWVLSEGAIAVRYLPSGSYPKICIQTKPGTLSITSGRKVAPSEVETILLDVEDGRVNSTLAPQSAAAAAVFAALDLYDRRRGIDFAPAYLAFLRAKASGNPAATRAALLAASDELLVALLNDYGTDRVPPAWRWQNAAGNCGRGAGCAAAFRPPSWLPAMRRAGAGGEGARGRTASAGG